MPLRSAKNLTLYAIGVLFLLGIYFGYLYSSGNFHETIRGEFYRSGQLSPGDIAKYSERYGIRSIINLRGENDHAPWYIDEVAEAKDAHVEHLDFRMSAHHQLTQEQAENLINMMRNAPKPVLIHCQAGSDRTGLASALYIAAIKKGSEDDAEDQLSMFYGHLDLPFTRGYAMSETFEALEPWLGYDGS